MIEFALWFYLNYQRLFYLLLTLAVILEGPIVILTLTSLSWTLGIPLPIILLFAIIWDVWGDILHFFIGKYGKKLLSSIPITQNFKIQNQTFLTFNEKIKNYPLLEKLIIIKYTPPISSAGLIYLWASGLSFRKFIITTLPLCLLSSGLVFIIGFFFSQYFTSQNHIIRFLMGLGLSIFLVLRIMRLLGSYLVKKIEKQHK